MDWILAEILCLKQGGYGGRARYILKDALKYIPLYGWQLGEVSFHGNTFFAGSMVSHTYPEMNLFLFFLCCSVEAFTSRDRKTKTRKN